jgi:hypothetical protein
LLLPASPNTPPKQGEELKKYCQGQCRFQVANPVRLAPAIVVQERLLTDNLSFAASSRQDFLEV